MNRICCTKQKIILTSSLHFMTEILDNPVYFRAFWLLIPFKKKLSDIRIRISVSVSECLSVSDYPYPYPYRKSIRIRIFRKFGYPINTTINTYICQLQEMSDMLYLCKVTYVTYNMEFSFFTFVGYYLVRSCVVKVRYEREDVCYSQFIL